MRLHESCGRSCLSDIIDVSSDGQRLSRREQQVQHRHRVRSVSDFGNLICEIPREAGRDAKPYERAEPSNSQPTVSRGHRRSPEDHN